MTSEINKEEISSFLSSVKFWKAEYSLVFRGEAEGAD